MLKILNPEKLIKYTVPVFVLAIVSRSIEEMSFIYYAVPVMCVLFIVLMFYTLSAKSSVQSSMSNSHSGEDDQMKSRPESDTIDSEQVGMTGSRQAGVTHFRRTSFAGMTWLLFLIPGIWFLLTALWSSYPLVSATRALYFILISTGSISAGMLWIRYSGQNIFDLFLPANIIVVLICLFSLVLNIPLDSWTGGHGKGFMGFFGHQNLLASVLLFTIPAVSLRLVRQVNSKKHLSLKANSLRLTSYFLLLASNLILLTLTYSRASILSLVFGTIVFLILNKNWKFLSYSIIVLAMVTLIIYLTPAFNNFVDKIIKKDFPEVYSSRMWMWEPSYKAALEGGLVGLGYGISHPEIRSGEHSDHFEEGRLIREKGNSTLAIIEEAGLIGLILFLLPIIYVVRKFIIYNLEFRMNENKIRDYTLYIIPSTLAALLLHAQLEAWWIGVGSVQLPLFFIYIGILTGYQEVTFK